MSEQASMPIKSSAPVFKKTMSETVQMLQDYLVQADKSLAQLQSNIDTKTAEVNEYKRIQLMIVGQKQLINDIIGKTVEDKIEKTDKST